MSLFLLFFNLPLAITCSRPKSPHLLSNCTDAKDEWPMGAVCSYRCSTGFSLRGEPSAQCSETGQWSSLTPTCAEIQCLPFEDPAMGSVRCSGRSLGAVCEVSCNEGFHLQGASKAVCTENAQWDLEGQKPTCTGKQAHTGSH